MEQLKRLCSTRLFVEDATLHLTTTFEYEMSSYMVNLFNLGENPQLVSNEIQFSLPLPIEIIQPTEPKFTRQDQEAATSEDTNPSTSPSNVSKELLIVSELSVAVMPSRPDGEASSYDSPQFQSTLDTILEDKQLNVISPPPRPSSSEYTEEVITEESAEQLELDEQDKRDNYQEMVDVDCGADFVEKSGDDHKLVHPEDDVVDREEQDAHKPDKDDTNYKEMEGNDKTGDGSQDKDTCDGMMNSFVDSIYGPLEEYSNDDNSLEWECVLSSNCNYRVESIDEDSEYTNGGAKIYIVEYKEARTKTISCYSENELSSNVAKSSLHEESGDELEFYSCEIGDVIAVETPWCEYYGVLKEIECFEEKLSTVEHSFMLWNVMVQNEMTQSANDDRSPVSPCVEKEDVSVSDQKMEDSDKNKEISLESVSDNKKSVLTEEENNNEDCGKDESPFLLRTQLSADLTLAVKGTSQSTVILEWDDKSGIDSPVYYLMVFGDKFNNEVDSQYR